MKDLTKLIGYLTLGGFIILLIKTPISFTSSKPSIREMETMDYVSVSKDLFYGDREYKCVEWSYIGWDLKGNRTVYNTPRCSDYDSKEIL